MIIVPDGQLFLVPYNALQNRAEETKYLFESFRIRIVPSLTSLRLISNFPEDYTNRGGVLLVGNPRPHSQPLEFAESEVKKIRNDLQNKNAKDVKTLIGEQATKTEVLNQIESVALIHIAAHANVETGEICLAESGKDHVLTISDVQRYKLRARLVVLSCCNTGRGRITADGVIGIARAFLGAGARSVLVSLCEIDDEATTRVMDKFYEQLLDGKSASVAAQEAMKYCCRSSKYFSAVKYWAPFVLIGDDVTFDFGETEQERGK